MFSRNNENGANFKINSSLKAEAEEIGLQGKEIAEYVREQQALDREERADEIKIQIAQIEAAKEQDKLEAEKELKIKEMELQAQQAQATASSATTPTPRNKDAKSP